MTARRATVWILGGLGALMVATFIVSLMFTATLMVREQRDPSLTRVGGPALFVGAVVAGVLFALLLAWPRVPRWLRLGIGLLSVAALAESALVEWLAGPNPPEFESIDDSVAHALSNLSWGLFGLVLVPTFGCAIIAVAVALRAGLRYRRRPGWVAMAIGAVAALPAAAVVWLSDGIGLTFLGATTHTRAQNWFGYWESFPPSLATGSRGQLLLLSVAALIIGGGALALLVSDLFGPVAQVLAGAAFVTGGVWSIAQTMVTDYQVYVTIVVEPNDPWRATFWQAVQAPAAGDAIVIGATLLMVAALGLARRRWADRRPAGPVPVLTTAQPGPTGALMEAEGVELGVGPAAGGGYVAPEVGPAAMPVRDGDLVHR
jgi:hypothetical protein